jgi:hypothetical protein
MSYTLYNSTDYFNFTGLINYYSFDRNTSIIRDLSGNVKDGVNYGNATWNISGKLGADYEFDGSNDYINLSDVSSIIQNFTFFAWVYPKNLNNRHEIIDAYGKYFNIQDGKLKIYISGVSTGYSSSTINLTINQWNFVGAYWNGTDIFTYVNGVKTNNALSGTATPIANSNVIGLQSYGGPGAYFNGSIDEVMIFNRSLSASEISALYNRSLVNHTEYSTTQNSINFTNLNDGYYSYFADILDKVGNYNSTSIRNIMLDTVKPLLTINSPLNNTVYSFPGWINLTVNASASDLNGISSMWYNIDNGQNVTFDNITGIHFEQGDGETKYYNLNIYVNDSSNNVNYSTYYIIISQTATAGTLGGSSTSVSQREYLICSECYNFIMNRSINTTLKYNDSDLKYLQNTLSNLSINTTMNEIDLYIKNYNVECSDFLQLPFNPKFSSIIEVKVEKLTWRDNIINFTKTIFGSIQTFILFVMAILVAGVGVLKWKKII